MSSSSNITSVDRATQAVLAIAGDIADGEVALDLDPVVGGFDSLSIMELSARLEAELGVACTVEDIFDTTSLGRLAAVLAERLEAV